MQRPLLRKPVCEIEEILADAFDASPAQTHTSHPSPDELDASGTGSQLRSSGPADSRLLPATALSDEEDEFHDIPEPASPPDAHPEAALSSSAHDADDAESFHDVVERTPSSSMPMAGSQAHCESSTDVFQSSPVAAHLDLPASLMDCPPFTIPPASEGAAAAAAESGYGKLPSPELYRRVRSPQSGSRPYPSHPAEPSVKAQTAARVGVPGVEADAGERVYQEGREEVDLNSLPAAGARESREYSAEEIQVWGDKQMSSITVHSANNRLQPDRHNPMQLLLK